MALHLPLSPLFSRTSLSQYIGQSHPRAFQSRPFLSSIPLSPPSCLLVFISPPPVRFLSSSTNGPFRHSSSLEIISRKSLGLCQNKGFFRSARIQSCLNNYRSDQGSTKNKNLSSLPPASDVPLLFSRHLQQFAHRSVSHLKQMVTQICTLLLPFSDWKSLRKTWIIIPLTAFLITVASFAGLGLEVRQSHALRPEASVTQTVNSVDTSTRDLGTVRVSENVHPLASQASSSLVVQTGSLSSEEEIDLEIWLEGVREEARLEGISEKMMELALNGVRPLPKVIEKDRNQPEFVLTAKEYLDKRVTPQIVKKATESYFGSQEVLEVVEKQYGVPGSVLVAIWGTESSYGRNQGRFDTIQALLTLARNSNQPRRAAYFRRELVAALRIMDKDKGANFEQRLRGSWAGAMGQCQFMPSSYKAYAVDFDGDGKADIWASEADVFASMANYLVKNGWKPGGPIGQKVKLPKGFNRKHLGLQVQKTVSEWKDSFRVTPESDGPGLPLEALASLVAPDGCNGPVYLACSNFRAILKYNGASLYGLAVAQLATEIDAQLVQQNAPTISQ